MDVGYESQVTRMAVSLQDAMAFIERHGVVLESGHGPVPSLAEAVAGEPIRGSWWGHARGHEIFAATRAIRASPEVLVCRLIERKITYVHRRLWPALVRLASRVDPTRLTAVREEHTSAGAHRVHETAFPEWVPADVQQAAMTLSEDDAMNAFGSERSGWLT